MTYKEALEYIHSVSWKGSRPGLSRIAELCEKMSHPEAGLRFVHVAGTNGKGSVCCMLSEVLRASGLRVGLFTSPFVREFNERIRVNGENIGDEELASATEYVKQFADTMEDAPTEFELITAIAFAYFARRKCDIVVLEVGMGGRLDSTNVIETTVLSVITEISLDHTAVLGDTIAKIAAEKAGIIKPGVPVVFAGTDESAFGVIAEKAAEKGSPLTRPAYETVRVSETSIDGTVFEYAGRTPYRISLAGTYQPRNAAAVIHCADVLRTCGYSIGEDALRAGLLAARWSARFEVLCRDPVVIYDGGHNPGGVTVAFESAVRCFPKERFTVLTGVMADKEYEKIAGIAAPHIAKAFTVTPAVPRALDAAAYAEVYRGYGVDAVDCENIEAGVRAALEDARRNHRPLILFGSLYMYADVAAAVERCVSVR